MSVREYYLVEFPIDHKPEELEALRKSLGLRYCITFKLIDTPIIKKVTKEEFLSYIGED